MYVTQLISLKKIHHKLTLKTHFINDLLYFIHSVGVSLVAQNDKESACNAEDLGLIPGLGKSPREGLGNPLQYCGLENSDGLRSLVGYSPWVTKSQRN